MNKRLYGDNNNDNNNQLNPSLQQQNLLNPTMRSLSPSLQGLNNNPLLSSMNPLLQNNFQQQIPTLSPLPAPQNPIPPYLSSSYGYGYPSSSSAFDAGGTPLDYNYYSTAGQQQQQYSSQLAQQLGNGGGMYGPTKTSSNWPLYYEPMYSLYYPLYGRYFSNFVFRI
jgi:hypothetical protein